jgi:hypothetical protein
MLAKGRGPLSAVKNEGVSLRQLVAKQPDARFFFALRFFSLQLAR